MARPATHHRRGLLAAVVALVVLVVLVVGFALGRASVRGDPAAEPVEATGPGPTRTVSGVPRGYARTEAGAVSAAANYTVVLGDRSNLGPAFGARAFPAFTLPAARADLLGRSDGFAASVPDAAALATDPAVALRAAPLGYRIERYAGDEAVVSIWYVAVGVGTVELPMSSAWGTDRFTLRWSEGDWKVADLVGEAGPEPPGGAPPAEDPALAARVNAFLPFVYQPGEAP